MSLGFALVGAVMWWIAAYLTGHEFGIIAWALGGMAGAGMAMGYGHQDALSGLAAAAMAFLGIWAANAMILASVFANPEKFGVDLDEMAVEEHAVDAAAVEKPLPGASAGASQADGEMADAEPVEDQNAPEMVPDQEIPAGAKTAILGIALVVGSFVLCFAGIFKIIALVLALSSAYKIGSNGGFGS
ncbi:MAG: hypothetical protein HUU20_00040 [Pirellulales bacterium]|nr:hypothetical protein [Pirellulales bacterium]